MYGSLPTDEVLGILTHQRIINIGDYKEQSSQSFSMAWKLTQKGIEKVEE